jgi:hypothetical protein
MNVFDLFESPQLGAPSNGIGAQSAADQHSASPIGSGTTKREAKKKPVTMMGVAVKEDIEEGWFDSPAPTGEKWYLKKDGAVLRTVNGEPFTFKDRESALAWAKKTYKVSFDQQRILPTTNPDKNLIREPRAQMEAGKPIKSNFKMPPESLQDKMYRQHQELRKQRGAPSPEEYKQRIAQKQAEIDALKEGILDRAAPKLPKPRNPANAVLGNKVNAAGKHLDKKRRQELAPKHKNKDPLDESASKGAKPGWMLKQDPALAKKVKDSKRGHEELKKWAGKPVPNQDKEQEVDEGWKSAVAGAALAGSMALGGGAAHAAEPVVGVGQSQNMQMAVDMAKHNATVKYLKSVHGDNFQGKQMPEYRFGKLDLKPNDKGGYVASVPLIVDNEVQEDAVAIKKKISKYEELALAANRAGDDAKCKMYQKKIQALKSQSVEEDISRRGFLKALGGAALAGAGVSAADAQNIDLPGPQVSYIAHVIADVNGREVNKTVNLGTQYQSKEQVEQELEEYMQSKGITRYSIRVEQTYDRPGYIDSNQPRGGTATGRDFGNPGLGDMIAGRISREIRAGIPSKGGYATGGTTKGQRPRDGSQWWRDQLPQIMKEEPLEEDIERHLLQMRRAGYDIVQEEWSDQYKSSINCSNPKGFSQKAHCAGKNKNEDVSEEKVRLDPKCWTGKKIGNPKTKMKGGVRVNNCVPK